MKSTKAEDLIYDYLKEDEFDFDLLDENVKTLPSDMRNAVKNFTRKLNTSRVQPRIVKDFFRDLNLYLSKKGRYTKEVVIDAIEKLSKIKRYIVIGGLVMSVLVPVMLTGNLTSRLFGALGSMFKGSDSIDDEPQELGVKRYADTMPDSETITRPVGSSMPLRGINKLYKGNAYTLVGDKDAFIINVGDMFSVIDTFMDDDGDPTIHFKMLSGSEKGQEHYYAVGPRFDTAIKAISDDEAIAVDGEKPDIEHW